MAQKSATIANLVSMPLKSDTWLHFGLSVYMNSGSANQLRRGRLSLSILLLIQRSWQGAPRRGMVACFSAPLGTKFDQLRWPRWQQVSCVAHNSKADSIEKERELLPSSRNQLDWGFSEMHRLQARGINNTPTSVLFPSDGNLSLIPPATFTSASSITNVQFSSQAHNAADHHGHSWSTSHSGQVLLHLHLRRLLGSGAMYVIGYLNQFYRTDMLCSYHWLQSSHELQELQDSWRGTSFRVLRERWHIVHLSSLCCFELGSIRDTTTILRFCYDDDR